jgi:transcriptional regulator GlxA family with amidase domain
MLEFAKKTIEQIAWAIGYEDPSSFRKVFHRVVGSSRRPVNIATVSPWR